MGASYLKLSIFWFKGSSGEFGDLPVNMVSEEMSGGFGFGTGWLICYFLSLTI